MYSPSATAYFGASTLSFGEYDSSKYTQYPGHTLNAGLYTGEPFNGAWGNVPVVPETDVYIHQNLRSANPPPGAIVQYPHNVRPGNNYQAMPGVTKFNPATHAVQCTVPVNYQPVEQTPFQTTVPKHCADFTTL